MARILTKMGRVLPRLREGVVVKGHWCQFVLTWLSVGGEVLLDGLVGSFPIDFHLRTGEARNLAHHVERVVVDVV